MNGLDLFSGIGGISLALSEWVKPVAYCENDRYAQAVLLSRMAAGDIAKAPIWNDVQTLRGEYLPRVDIVYGGFPCQDISVAGAGAGLGGERSGLFFEIVRLVRELRPRFVFLENVAVITVRGLDRVLLELTALGYDSRWTIVSAAEVGACHLRERWFLLAHADSIDLRLKPDRFAECETSSEFRKHEQEEYAADPNGSRLEGVRRSKSGIARPCVYNGWKSQPVLRRGVNGVSNRVDRIRGLGNAVVPFQAREAFMRLAGLR